MQLQVWLQGQPWHGHGRRCHHQHGVASVAMRCELVLQEDVGVEIVLRHLWLVVGSLITLRHGVLLQSENAVAARGRCHRVRRHRIQRRELLPLMLRWSLTKRLAGKANRRRARVTSRKQIRQTDLTCRRVILPIAGAAPRPPQARCRGRALDRRAGGLGSGAAAGAAAQGGRAGAEAVALGECSRVPFVQLPPPAAQLPVELPLRGPGARVRGPRLR
mmetsp:Transcript_65613/g.166265  ORF Transcript_65613/g.166265 Transcript_65613/m.166265 type:complete len:218 (+) Transcript_65613:786-1439(+)